MSNRFPMSATGRVATDPELSTGQNGTTRVRFRVAVNDRVQQSDGQWADGQTVFHDVVAFGESAKTYAETFRKGDAVAVMGELRFNTYTTRDGEPRTGNQIVASVVAPDPRLTTLTIDRSRNAERSTPGMAAAAPSSGMAPGQGAPAAESAPAAPPTWPHQPVSVPPPPPAPAPSQVSEDRPAGIAR